MKQNITLILCALLFLVSTIQAHTREFQKAQHYLEIQNEVYFSFSISSNMDLDRLGSMISLDHRAGYTMYAYANTKEFNAFLNENIDFTVHKPAGEDYDPSSVYTGDLDAYQGEKLLNYSDYVAFIKKCAADNPTICKSYEMGKSGKGKDMLCLRITAGLGSNDNPKRPRFFFASAVHGDELNGTLIGYGLIHFLIKGHRSNDPFVQKYLEGMEIWIAPHLNPDGTFPNGNTMAGCRRGNASGTDLNRSYPRPNLSRSEYQQWLEEMSIAAPETKPTMEFALKHQFNMEIDNHDAMREVITHWSSKRVVPVTMEWMKAVGSEFAREVGWKGPTQAAFSSGGVAGGTRMDWGPFYNHCWGFTMEYTNKGSSPQCSWNRYKGAILKLFDEAMCGISGTITNGSGQGLSGVKVVLSKNGKTWDKHGSEAYSRDGGYYVHYAPGGTYDVIFTNNSQSKTISNVTVTNGKATELNCVIGNTGISMATDHNNDQFCFQPVKNGVKISWEAISEIPTISIFSLKGLLIAKLRPTTIAGKSLVWTKTTGSSLTVGKGCYFAHITFDNKVYSQKFTLAQ